MTSSMTSSSLKLSHDLKELNINPSIQNTTPTSLFTSKENNNISSFSQDSGIVSTSDSVFKTLRKDSPSPLMKFGDENNCNFNSIFTSAISEFTPDKTNCNIFADERNCTEIFDLGKIEIGNSRVQDFKLPETTPASQTQKISIQAPTFTLEQLDLSNHMSKLKSKKKTRALPTLPYPCKKSE